MLKYRMLSSGVRKVLYIAVFLIGLWFYGEYLEPVRFDFPVHGFASWYSREDPGVGKFTANREKFDDSAMTCAAWGVPFGTHLKVTNKSNGRYVIVRVNDRGPHRRLVRKGRVIDLTKSAFRKIGSTKKGLIRVKVERLDDPSFKR
ncbi:MAG: septal ring lytic transglycosylase RlpA family protein [Candidatus Omnitrophota bacterium]